MAAKQRCAFPGTSSKCKWSTSSPGSSPSFGWEVRGRERREREKEKGRKRVGM